MESARWNETIVVGSGLVGWSVARELALRKMPVTVIEGDLPGGATLAAAGMITPGTVRNPPPNFLPLAIGAMAHYPTLIGDLIEGGAGDPGFAVVGGLCVARNEIEQAWLNRVERDLRERSAAGLGMIGAIHRVGGDKAREIVPALAADVIEATHYTGAAMVQGRALLEAIRSDAIARGATAIGGEASLFWSGDAVGIRVEGKEQSEVNAVVLAAGAWTGELGRSIGLIIPIVPQRGQLLHLAGNGDVGGRLPVIELMSHHYVLGFSEGGFVVGATREDGVGFDPVQTPVALRDLLGVGLAILPNLQSAELREVRVGLRPMSGTGMPLIGKLAGTPNGWICAGHGPLGLTLGPFTAHLLAGMMAGQRPIWSVKTN